MTKLQHWRGFRSINGLEAAPMLEFDRCLLRERPGREPERAVPRRVFASQPNAKFKYGGVVLA